MAWSDAARAAALAARRAHGMGLSKYKALKPFAAARRESRKGYVQHVEMGTHGLRRSDWFGDETLASYQSGRTLSSNESMNKVLRAMGKKGRRR